MSTTISAIRRPVNAPFKIQQEFSSKHTGVDYSDLTPAASVNKDIFSPCDGIVVRIGRGRYDGKINIGYDYGLWMVIQDTYGATHFLAHLNSILVELNKPVKAGQHVAEMGRSGNTSGYHVHWSIYGTLWDRKTLLAPASYIANHPAKIIADPPKPNPSPADKVWAFNPPSKAVQKSIQNSLKKRGRYTGPVNGIFGPNTVKGIQKTIQNVGYPGLVNGIEGPLTCEYIQRYAAKFGGYTGPINGILGPNSWAGLAYGLAKGLK